MKVVQMKKISRKLNLKIKRSHAKHIESFNIKCPVLGCFGNLLAVQQFHHHLKRNFHKFLAPHSNTSNTFWTLEAMLFNCFVLGKNFYFIKRFIIFIHKVKCANALFKVQRGSNGCKNRVTSEFSNNYTGR